METSIGPYIIQRLINGGGQGRVYLGYDRRLHRQVAIKIHALPEGRKARRRALDEARRVAGIHSPRVVQIFDVVQSSDYLAMVMEYVPGCDLEDFLAAARPSLASVLTVAADLATALAASRQQGLVHGDLKAANVLVTPQGRVKLTDFGIARAVGVEGGGAGSLSAVAPEQLAGLDLDIRTDLFALGRLLYRMLTGEQSLPTAPVSVLQALPEGQQDSRFESLALADGEEVPVELLSLVDQLLRLDPEHRPRNTHQVRRVLRKLSGQLPLSSAASLLREARPFFRPESPTDIPPAIPDQLCQHGRSSNTRWALWDWKQAVQARLPTVALAALVSMAVAIPLVAAWQGQVTRIHIDEPRVEVLAGGSPALSAPAMVATVRGAVAALDESARFSGAARERVIHTADRHLAADEHIALELRCDLLACIFVLRRQFDGESRSRQVLLARQQAADYWAEQLRLATLALYHP